jgi:protocatechuate 3,4-dioxygenase beta subunit
VGKGARWVAGLVVVAAAVGGGAWWLLQGRGDVAATREEAALESDVAPQLPAATDTAELPTPNAAAGGKPLALAEAEATAPAPVADTSPVSFTGRIVDASGRAVVGALVHHMPTSWRQQKLGIKLDPIAPALDLEKMAQAQTGSDGRFSLLVVDHAPEHAASDNGGDWNGSWDDVPRLLALHPAFETHLVSCVGWRGGAFDVGDIVLAPGVALSGRAVDERGLPLAGVSVAVPRFDDSEDGARRGEWWLVRSTVHALTGDDGRFVLDGFWSGPHRLELRAAGRRPVLREFSGQAGTPLDLGDIVLEPGGVIEGLVTDTQGQPIPGARVLARPAKMVELISLPKRVGEHPDDIASQFASRMGSADSVVDVDTLADANGAFRLDSLDPKSAPFCIYSGKDGFEPVRVDDVALDVPPLRLQLGAVASLLLSVVDPQSHEPIADAKVTARRSSRFGDHGLPLTVTAGAELQVAGVEPPYTGLFLLAPAGGARNTAVLSAPGRATQSFELPAVEPGERRSVSVELPRAARVAGRVLDARRQPIAGAMVTLAPADPPESSAESAKPGRATSDAEGRFAFEGLPAGDVVVRASAAGFVAAASLPLAVKAATPIEDIELVLQQAGAIAGVVLSGGKPLANAHVEALSVAQAEAIRRVEQAKGSYNLKSDGLSRDVHTARCDAQGHFRIDDLPPEPFELTGPPGVQVTADVRAGETTDVSLAARALPHIRGHVSDAKGPVAGARINASMYFEPLKAWLNGFQSSPVTDANGNFDMELDSTGHWKLGADLGKAHSPSVELDVDWDQVQWVELKMSSGS